MYHSANLILIHASKCESQNATCIILRISKRDMYHSAKIPERYVYRFANLKTLRVSICESHFEACIILRISF